MYLFLLKSHIPVHFFRLFEILFLVRCPLVLLFGMFHLFSFQILGFSLFQKIRLYQIHLVLCSFQHYACGSNLDYCLHILLFLRILKWSLIMGLIFLQILVLDVLFLGVAHIYMFHDFAFYCRNPLCFLVCTFDFVLFLFWRMFWIFFGLILLSVLVLFLHLIFQCACAFFVFGRHHKMNLSFDRIFYNLGYYSTF